MTKPIKPYYALLPYKNPAAALLLSVFLGPIGLLYSTIIGGIVMLCVAMVVLSSHYPFPVILMWISCCIWSVIAANRYNKKITEARLRIDEEKNYSSGSAS